MFFISMLFFTALFGGIFIMGPAFALLLISERWFRWYNDFAVRLWLILPGVCAYITLFILSSKFISIAYEKIILYKDFSKPGCLVLLL